MIDYKSIIEGLRDEDIIKLLSELGADRYKETNNEIIFPTICHNSNTEEASMKLYYYKDTHLFYCYTNCEKMSIFNFLEEYYNTRDIEYDWYKDIYKVILSCSASQGNTAPINHLVNLRERYRVREDYKFKTYNKGVLDTFSRFYAPEWLNDNISREAMDKYNIKYSISQNKIIIPHYDIDNNLIGIRGRALNEWEIENIGKYMPVKIEETWYKHPLSLNLYGLNINKENIKQRRIVFVCEGEKSVLQAESFSQPNCTVAVCGSNFSKFQLRLLLKECQPQEIVLCFDNEEKDGSFKYFNKLMNIGKRYINYCDFSFIYDIDRLLKPKQSPTDCGEEIFNKLLERRVKIKCK